MRKNLLFVLSSLLPFLTLGSAKCCDYAIGNNGGAEWAPASQKAICYDGTQQKDHCGYGGCNLFACKCKGVESVVLGQTVVWGTSFYLTSFTLYPWQVDPKSTLLYCRSDYGALLISGATKAASHVHVETTQLIDENGVRTHTGVVTCAYEEASLDGPCVPKPTTTTTTTTPDPWATEPGCVGNPTKGGKCTGINAGGHEDYAVPADGLPAVKGRAIETGFKSVTVRATSLASAAEVEEMEHRGATPATTATSTVAAAGLSHITPAPKFTPVSEWSEQQQEESYCDELHMRVSNGTGLVDLEAYLGYWGVKLDQSDLEERGISEEMREYRRQKFIDLVEMFKRRDKDGDGFLNKEEGDALL